MGGECDTADDLRRMIRLHHKMGADLIKVMSTGGFMTKGSVCPTMNMHALTMRDRFGDALEKVIMGLYSHGVQGRGREFVPVPRPAGVRAVPSGDGAGPAGPAGHGSS